MKSHLELGKCYLELGKLQEAQQALSQPWELTLILGNPMSCSFRSSRGSTTTRSEKSELAILEKLEQEEKEKVQGAVEKQRRKTNDPYRSLAFSPAGRIADVAWDP